MTDDKARAIDQSSDGMKGVTPAILYNMCLGLDNLYSESIDGLDESIRKKVHALFMVRWNTFHAPVHSACFPMDNSDSWKYSVAKWN